MACLINSIDELPKDLPSAFYTEEEWIEFANGYVCVVNGQELQFALCEFMENSSPYCILIYTPDGRFTEEDSDVGVTLGVYPGKILGDPDTIRIDGSTFDPVTTFTMCEKTPESKTICGVPVCDDGKEPIVITPTSTKIGNEYAGTSDKSKPASVPQYSLYLELDAGKFYYYDNGEWNEISCGGGSGSNKAKIIIDNSSSDVAVPDIFICPCGTTVDCVSLDTLPLLSGDETIVELDASIFIGESVRILNDGEHTIRVTGLLNEDIDGGYYSSQCFTMVSGDTLSIVNQDK